MKSLILLALISITLSLANDITKTPPMGFNTWNHFYCNINENIIKTTADAMIKLGLKELGYNYVNIDDCWMSNTRNKNGQLEPDPVRFGSGIAHLADYCHERGLLLGIYSSAGSMTCQGLPASLDHEDTDAQSFAGWGVDYLKYDNCYHGPKSGKERYTTMQGAIRDAIAKTKRDMYYSICNWGEEKAWNWAPGIGNSWRISEDIEDHFDSVRSIYNHSMKLVDLAGPGKWNDLDMLEVGNGHMTTNEYRTHFTLWAMAKSPLIIGCDLAAISQQDLDILKNKGIIDLNQDKLGKPAHCVENCECSKTLNKAHTTVMKLENGDYAIALTNWNDKETLTNVEVDFSRLKLEGSSFKVKDLWQNIELGTKDNRFEVKDIEVHDTRVYRLTKA